MKTTLRVSALLTFGALTAFAAHAAPQASTVASGALTSPASQAPAIQAPPVSAAVNAPLPGAPVAARAETPPVSKASGTPTLGDWDDLYQRQAYQEQMKKLAGDDAKAGQPTASSLPTPLPQLPIPGQLTDKQEPKKKLRASESCPDDGSACFYSVYGMSVEGGANNYRGLLAIDGRVVPVYKNAAFRTAKGQYTVKSISTHELVVTAPSKRRLVIAYAGDADYSPDPIELKPADKSPASPFMPFVPSSVR